MVLGYLINRSKYLPSIFGLMIGVAGFIYVVDSFTHFIFPIFSGITELLVIIIAVISEVSYAIWLTVKGAKLTDTKKATEINQWLLIMKQDIYSTISFPFISA